MSDRLQREVTPIKDPIVKPAPASVLEPSIRRQQLGKWLGKTFRVVITDGRVLVGFFNCTDKDANVVLSVCAEYLEEGKDARILGNVMIPGKHIVSIGVDMPHEEALGTYSALGYANGPLNDGYETIKPLVQ